MLSPLKKSEKGWEHFPDYHMTLLFVGPTAEDLIPSIVDRLKRVSVKPFTLRTSTFDFFGCRIMYLGFEPSPELLALRRQITDLFPEYHRIHEKDFVPHVTVKRTQRYEFDSLSERVATYPAHPVLIPVEGIALFKSEKDEANQRYHVLERVNF